jgi:hypothetical protein
MPTIRTGSAQKSGKILPDRRPAPFKGTITETYKTSKPDFPKTREAPEGAPNVIVILLDDVGFGAPSTFGGPIPATTLDKVAKSGLRYTQWHTTALCSPTSMGSISTQCRPYHVSGPEADWHVCF